MSTQNQRQPSRKKRPVPGYFQMTPEPASISSENQEPTDQPNKMPSSPAINASPSMFTAIKNSRKGKIPPGLARYLAAHKKGAK